MTTDASSHSRLQEKILEDLFISDLLCALWRGGHRDTEVLRREVDSGGYDVVLVHNGVVRHVQLKATVEGRKTAKHKVNVALARTPSGCIVWLNFDPTTLRVSPTLRWFGAGPGERLPDLSGTASQRTPSRTRRERRPRGGASVSCPLASSRA